MPSHIDWFAWSLVMVMAWLAKSTASLAAVGSALVQLVWAGFALMAGIAGCCGLFILVMLVWAVLLALRPSHDS